MTHSNNLINSDERPTKEVSLLMLNNDCLMKIFQILELMDFVNLAKACIRLQEVADETFVPKCKEIEIQVEYYCKHCSIDKCLNEARERSQNTKEEFADIISVIGPHVLSVRMYDGNDFILEIIKDYCKKVNSLKFHRYDNPPHLEDFKSLKELKLYGPKLCNNALKNYFTNNPDIESLGYCEVDEDFLKLLTLLPKLKTLELEWSRVSDSINPNQIKHLLHLYYLRKFEFRCESNCNQFLNELATKLNLTDLKFNMNTDDDTFDIIKSFQNLEVLSICHEGSDGQIPENATFPSKLKRIELFTPMKCSSLVTIIKQLKFLEEVELEGIMIDIESDEDGVDEYDEEIEGENEDEVRARDEDNIISRIVEELKAELNQRTLKIIYWENDEEGNKLVLYNSANLKIVSDSYIRNETLSKKTTFEIVNSKLF